MYFSLSAHTLAKFTWKGCLLICLHKSQMRLRLNTPASTVFLISVSLSPSRSCLGFSDTLPFLFHQEQSSCMTSTSSLADGQSFSSHAHTIELSCFPPIFISVSIIPPRQGFPQQAWSYPELHTSLAGTATHRSFSSFARRLTPSPPFTTLTLGWFLDTSPSAYISHELFPFSALIFNQS